MAEGRWLGMMAIALALAGCATKPAPTLSQAEFENTRDALAADPAARTALAAACRADMQREPEDERALIGAVLDVETDEVAEVFCARFIAAISRGDLSYADFEALKADGGDPAALRHFLRVLRRDPSAVST